MICKSGLTKSCLVHPNTSLPPPPLDTNTHTPRPHSAGCCTSSEVRFLNWTPDLFALVFICLVVETRTEYRRLATMLIFTTCFFLLGAGVGGGGWCGHWTWLLNVSSGWKRLAKSWKVLSCAVTLQQNWGAVTWPWRDLDVTLAGDSVGVREAWGAETCTVDMWSFRSLFYLPLLF